MPNKFVWLTSNESQRSSCQQHKQSVRFLSESQRECDFSACFLLFSLLFLLLFLLFYFFLYGYNQKDWKGVFNKCPSSPSPSFSLETGVWLQKYSHESLKMSDVMDKIQLEGLSDFSKLIEVLRAKYIDEKSFNELKTNEEKVQFCLEKEEVRSSFQSFIKTCFGNRSYEPKSGEKCQHYRQEGNKCFRGKKFQEALNFYSKVWILLV